MEVVVDLGCLFVTQVGFLEAKDPYFIFVHVSIDCVPFIFTIVYGVGTSPLHI